MRSVRNAYRGVHIAQRTLEQLIREYARSIVKSEQTVVREDGAHAHEVRVQYSLMRETRQARVTVDECYALAEYDSPQIGQEGKEVGERRGGCDGGEGDIVHLEGWQQPADAYTVRWVTVCYHYYLGLLEVRSVSERDDGRRLRCGRAG